MLRGLVIVDRHLRRVWCCGQRIHHGAVGVGMIALGTLLCVHDRSDAYEWFRREPNP
jgi:hypothetical protein